MRITLVISYFFLILFGLIFLLFRVNKVSAQTCNPSVVIQPAWCYAVSDEIGNRCELGYWLGNRTYACDTSSSECRTVLNVCSSNDQQTCESKTYPNCDFLPNECEPGYCGTANVTCGGDAGSCSGNCPSGQSCQWVAAARECRCRSSTAPGRFFVGQVYFDADANGWIGDDRLVNSSMIRCDGSQDWCGGWGDSTPCKEKCSGADSCDSNGCGTRNQGTEKNPRCYLYDACNPAHASCETIDGIGVIVEGVREGGYPDDCNDGRERRPPWYSVRVGNNLTLSLPVGYRVVGARNYPDNCAYSNGTVYCTGEWTRNYNQVDFLIRYENSCTLTTNDFSMEVGEIRPIPYSISPGGVNLSSITFRLTGGNVNNFRICSDSSCSTEFSEYTDTTPAFIDYIHALAPGSASLSISAVMEGGIACNNGNPITATVTVNDYSPWFQRE